MILCRFERQTVLLLKRARRRLKHKSTPNNVFTFDRLWKRRRERERERTESKYSRLPFTSRSLEPCRWRRRDDASIESFDRWSKRGRQNCVAAKLRERTRDFQNRPYNSRLLRACETLKNGESPGFHDKTSRLFSRLRVLKRALSPRKRRRRIVAEKTYGRAQQRASVYRDDVFYANFLTTALNFTAHDANLCCLLFERELRTMPSLRASVPAIGPRFNKYFEESRVHVRTSFCRLWRPSLTREERTIEKFYRETPR